MTRVPPPSLKGLASVSLLAGALAAGTAQAATTINLSYNGAQIGRAHV